MKKLLFVLATFLSLSTCKADDFDKYRAAFDYITSDTLNLNNWFKQEMKYDTLPIINVSNEIVYIGDLFFLDSIIAYEKIKHPSDWHYILFKDSLSKVFDSLYYFKTFTDDKLLQLNRNKEKKFVIYFSKIDDRKILKAMVIPYEKGYEKYSDTWHYGYRIVDYLFYFKKNSIKKAIRIEGWVN